MKRGFHTFRHSGEFQYFRIPVELWEKNLPKLKELHIDTVSTYIPWIWHEIEEGKFDFTGETHEQRNLIKLLELVKKNNLKVIVKPGPYIYAEYEGLGVPKWVGEKYPETLMVTEKGKILDNPTYGHPKLIELANVWYSNLFKAIQGYINDNTIIAIQIDNETGLFQAANILEKVDYNPHIINKFHEWLKRSYENDIKAFNRFHETVFTDFSKIMPPRGKINPSNKTNLLLWIDWSTFYQEYIIKYLEELKELISLFGFNVPILLNDSILDVHPVNTPLKFSVANVGLDIYAKALEGYKTVFDYPFSPSFDAKLISYYAHKFGYNAFGSEVQSGYLNPHTRVSMNQTWQLVITLLAHGLKGINWYIIHDAIEVDGVPYAYNSAFDYKGNPTERFDVHKKIGELIDEIKSDLLFSQELVDKVGILHHRNSTLAYLFSLADFLTIPKAVKGFAGALLDNLWNFGFLSLEESTIEDLRRYNTLILLSLGFLDESLHYKLERFVESGGTLITFPEPIIHDRYLNPIESKIYKFKVDSKDRPSDQSLLMKFGVWSLKWKAIKRKYKHKASEGTLWANYITEKFIGLLHKYKKQFKFQDLILDGYAKFNKLKEIEPGVAYPVLISDEGVYGYTTTLGDGKATTLGTLPFLQYDTPLYYSLTREEKQITRDVLCTLLNVKEKVIDSDENIEIVARKVEEDTFLLFIINRGNEKATTLKFNKDIFTKERYAVTYISSLNDFEHDKIIQENKMRIKIAANDAAVLRIE